MKKKILQVAHITEIPGPVQFLARFLEKKHGGIRKIYHPLEEARLKKSQFLKGNEIISEKIKNEIGISGYVSDFFTTLRWIKMIDGPIDKAVAMNCFDAFSLLAAKFFRMGKIKEIIFFNTDFSRRRFKNRFLNAVYVFVDRFSAKRADKICCNTKRTIKKRIEEGISPEKILYTPNGVFLEDIGGGYVPSKKLERKILYVGHISGAHGLGEILEILSGTDLSLDIIGSGKYESKMREIVADKNLSGKVNFLGFMPQTEVLEYMKIFSGFGIAPYGEEEDWTYYCDPVKVKEYLACFVPVVVSNLPEISETVREKRVGFVYEDISNLKKIFSEISDMDDRQYLEILERIGKVKEDLDLNKIYEKI